MPTGVTEANSELVQKLVALSRLRVGGEHDPEPFVRAYLGRADHTDLATSDLSDVCGAAVSLWRLVQDRATSKPRIRVYNPDWEQHGWQSPHTVIDIVTPDMPFLIDSLLMLLARLELDCHTLVHPLIDGHAVIHLEVDRINQQHRLDRLDNDVREVLANVSAAVSDWPAMRARARECAATLRSDPPSLPAEEVSEGADFLEWIADDHFTFLGARDYQLISSVNGDRLDVVPGSGLGILREESDTRAALIVLSARASRVARHRSLMVLTKTNARSTVHRAGRLDYVGVKLFDADGQVIGERRFIGIYGHSIDDGGCTEVPILGSKVRMALSRAGHRAGGRGEKITLRLLDNSPRDVLLQISTDAIAAAAQIADSLTGRKQVRVFPTRELFGRYYNCWVYLPRERYNTVVRERIETIICRALNGTEVEHSAQVDESVLARVLLVVWVAPEAAPVTLNLPELEEEIARATRSWKEELHDALIVHAGEERGSQLYLRYRAAFPASYQGDFPVRSAVLDIDRIEQLSDSDQLGMTLYHPVEGPEDSLRFKIVRRGAPMFLSDTLPLLENLGGWVVDERPYQVSPHDAEPVWIYDLGLDLPECGEINRVAFQEAFIAVWRGACENDGLNRLVLLAGITVRDVVVLRAVCKYLRQTGTAFSQSYMEDCLARNPQIASQLVQLFKARFDPNERLDTAPLVAQLETAVDAVASLDEDRILRRFLRAILAMLRTNFFQTVLTGEPKQYLSFKVNPTLIPEMPLPHPQYEIFVYSPTVEGTHLRGGATARGGLRWSDRKEDFRTEILGLMKAQNVKNAVIVPTGAKGGFVVKRQSADREAALAEGIRCYRTFISGLLDITDNIVDGAVVPPDDVVRFDGDDAYLVVAADKGTATFSDIANEISVERGFWLGDAFASGGSSGYDHKKMGITARGAWESVKRHFYELGVDCQAQDITVVGIGDMSGDVFGNGMLLSEHIRLVAAFDHRHVFLDPSPDAATSFAERRRLFALPRSSWADYDPGLISAGGGVFARTAKSIPLSVEVRAALEINAASLSPNDLIKAILSAPVDLVWNGGIGTYVKASWEQHSDAADRASDAVRVDATELRCRVIGEGGNLGLTQPARVEFALRGGLVNTDAVDNSAGVDCSDHEVNIKILLDAVVANGDLTGKQRDALLTEMADEVAELVLEDNREQTRALVNATAQAFSMRDVHTRYLHYLQHQGILDRSLEHLPNVDQLAERVTEVKGLVSPEFAVLLAYTKLLTYNALLRSDIPDCPYLSRELMAYFPAPIRQRYPEQIVRHPLRREIVATRLANVTVNRAGTSWLFRMVEDTGESICDVVRAHIAAVDLFDAHALQNRIVESASRITPATQTELILELRKLVERASRWLLHNVPLPIDLRRTVDEYRPGLARLAECLPELLDGTEREAFQAKIAELTGLGVSPELARAIAGFEDLVPGLDIARAADALDRSVEDVAMIYFSIGKVLEIGWLRDQITALDRGDRWRARARSAAREELFRSHITLATVVLTDEVSVQAAVDSWIREHKPGVERYRAVLEDLKACRILDHAAIIVGLRELRSLI